MSIRIKDSKMAGKAHQLLHDVFQTRQLILAKLLDQEDTNGLEKHVKRVAASNYSDQIVAGVQTIVVLTAKENDTVLEGDIGFFLGQRFRNAESFFEGAHRYMLSWLRKVKRDMPPWLEKR